MRQPAAVKCASRMRLASLDVGTPTIKNLKFTLEQATKARRGSEMHSSTLSLTSTLDLEWVVNATPRPLYPREMLVTHCTGGWVGPRAGLDGCGKSCPHRDSVPGPSSP